MKKKILSFIFAFIMLTSCLLLSACFNDYDTYWAVVPTDQSFYSTLNYTAKSVRDNYDYEYNFSVIRKNAKVAGEQREIIYVDYSYENKLNDYNSAYKLVYVAGKSFYLDGDSWQRDISSLWTKWSEAYGSMGNAGTYVELMTGPIWDRHFPQKYQTAKTNEYLEYKFKYDEETFRISNNMYHVLLYYHMKTSVHEINHNATLVLGESNFTVPYLNTITSEMLQD